MADTNTARTRDVVTAPEELAESWRISFPMEDGEIFYNLGCSDVKPH